MASGRPAAKKPLPDRLRDVLREQRQPYEQEPAHLVARRDNDHSVERRMLDDILGDIDRVAPPARPAPPGAGGDLLTTMAARLRQLEQAHKELQATAAAKDLQLRDSAEENASLRSQLSGRGDDSLLQVIGDENRELRRKVHDIEMFLSDYGLSWVGGEAPEAPTEAVDGADVDVVKLLAKLNDLQKRASSDGVTGPKLVSDGKKAQFKHTDTIRVAVYADGLFLRNGPFRSFASSAPARAFVKDVLDGYFPSEFKGDFPDGVPLDVVDRHESPFQKHGEVFGGAGRAAGRKVRTLADMGSAEMEVSAETLLKRLSSNVISQSGRIINVRDDVRTRLQGPPRSGDARPPVEPTAELPGDAAALQIRDGERRFVIKLRRDATLADLRSEIHKLTGRADGYELRTAYPNRAYNDAAATLEHEGLVPSATLFLQKV
ncbi:hypothetical protein M885DRAFT_522375 [Pelagophyceae sp. CCMP2097]|nr:hypothetical protein M885DRAFT_522375 [Pelagophyceae sp. CCMP2097]